MIKLIVFDLDGVLIDSKKLHYEALNIALSEFNITKISWFDHINKFDGLPTKEKLKLLNINNELSILINKKKQIITSDLINNYIVYNNNIVQLLTKLKNQGYVLSIASNSIKQTIIKCLNKLNIYSLFNYIVSNEDVVNSKPHSEMYLKCMINASINPKDTIIVEDSYIGRLGVFNSGAFLCPINEISDVNYEHIMYYINKANGIKHKWENKNMNILIPMAGAGSRFEKAGYVFPKPLIDVKGKPMIQAVVDNLNIEGQYIFIVQKSHYIKYNLYNMLNIIAPNCKIIQVDGLTDGAACTTLIAKDFINNNNPLLIANSDQIIDWDSSDFIYSINGESIDGSVVTFTNTHPKWSYVKVNNNIITEVAEKNPISDKATVGIYLWKHGSDYVKYAEQMILKNIRVNNEFYVCPVFNEAIQDNKKFKIYDIKTMYGIGTPEDLTYYLENTK